MSAYVALERRCPCCAGHILISLIAVADAAIAVAAAPAPASTAAATAVVGTDLEFAVRSNHTWRTPFALHNY